MSGDLSRPAMASEPPAPLPGDRVAEFTAFRQRMNERILAQDNQVVRRFFALDTQTYKDGASIMSVITAMTARGHTNGHSMVHM